MSDLPLPGLTPNDPETLLSTEARQRISRALLEYGRIRTSARSAIELRGYSGTSQAFINMREADIEAARTVIRAEAEEYGKLDLPGRRFREIMRMRIESMVYSLEFSNVQRDALEAEFLWPAHREPEDKRSAAERVRAFMAEHRLKHNGFAKAAGISPRNLAYVLSGVKVSYETQTCVANALGIKPQELFPS